jgi:hypothetical protein
VPILPEPMMATLVLGGITCSMKGKRKKFFFEKKNQKTFAPLRAVLKRF